MTGPTHLRRTRIHVAFQGGEVKISYHVYKLSFLNFLLGKQPNGPGQFIFGTVEPQTSTCMFPIDYSAMNATEEDIEPYKCVELRAILFSIKILF